jgi:hypothetical protein
MRRLFCTALFTLALLGAAAPANAQTADEKAVLDVVVKLFDGMRARDTAAMRAVFAEQALFYGVGQDGGVDTTTPSEFITSIAAAPAGLVLDEVLHDTEVRIDGQLATVWTYYDFFAGDRFSHCGYDAMQLLKVRGEWKIVALSDTRRREGCKQQRGAK